MGVQERVYSAMQQSITARRHLTTPNRHTKLPRDSQAHVSHSANLWALYVKVPNAPRPKAAQAASEVCMWQCACDVPLRGLALCQTGATASSATTRYLCVSYKAPALVPRTVQGDHERIHQPIAPIRTRTSTRPANKRIQYLSFVHLLTVLNAARRALGNSLTAWALLATSDARCCIPLRTARRHATPAHPRCYGTRAP